MAEGFGVPAVEITGFSVGDGPADVEDPVWLLLDCVPRGPVLDPGFAPAELGRTAEVGAEEETGPPEEEDAEGAREAPFLEASPVVCQEELGITLGKYIPTRF